jgi:hypothetical protein
VHDLAALRVVDKRSANDHPAVHHVSSIQARVVQIRYQEGVDDVDVRPAESILGSSSTRAIERGGIRSTTADRIKAVLPLTMVGRSIAKERICSWSCNFDGNEGGAGGSGGGNKGASGVLATLPERSTLVDVEDACSS